MSELEHSQADPARENLVRATASRRCTRVPSLKYWAVLLAAIFCAPPLASADVMYQYLGSPFTIPSPNAGLPFSGERVEGSFVIPEALANCGGTLPACDLSDLLMFNFTDGVDTYDSNTGIVPLAFTVNVTDGSITSWDISFNIPRMSQGPSCSTPGVLSCGFISFGPQSPDSAFYIDSTGEMDASAIGAQQPPVWSSCTLTGAASKIGAAFTPSDCGSSQVPEPGSLSLILAAFVATWGVAVLGGSRRGTRPTLQTA
jgi:hypothetical protein